MSASVPLAPLLPYLTALLVVVTVALMFLSVRYIREAKANGGRGGAVSPPPEAGASQLLPSRSLLQSIRLASAHLRQLVAGGAGIYEVPWVVAVGAGGADLDRLLPEPLPWPSDLAAAHRDLLGHVGRISFCRTGAVLDISNGLLDSPQWRQRWGSLIRALQTCRPQRPIDGLVVVIRASDLRTTSDQQDRLIARGDQIYHLIWSVQRMTGWRIPVYLLISGCEQLAGFSDWVLALPQHARHQMLGWSVPYALDSAFEPGWVDEGVAQLARQLSVAQLLLMMPEPDVAAAEGLLLFPGEVPRLAAPLSMFLTGMLRTSAYHEAFMFRGFFLTGRVPETIAGEPRSDAFAEALFTEKVFPEHQLAQPAYGEATRRRRQIRIAQTVLALSAVLCLVGVLRIRQLANDYFPSVRTLLLKIDQQVGARVLQRSNPGTVLASRERVRDAALNLLNAMAGIEISEMDTIAAPTSVLTYVNSRVEHAIAAGYDVVVLRAAYQALTEEPGLVAMLDPAPPPGAALPTSRQALSTTVEKVLEYDKYVSLYQGIAIRPRIGDIAALMSYALDVQLPPGFTSNYGLYEQALGSARMPPLRTRDVQPLVEKIVRQRFDAAIKDAYTGNQLATAVARLASLGSALGSQTSPSLASRRNLLADTQTTLDRIAGLLRQPSYDWLSGKPDPTAPWLVLDRLKDVRVVRPDFIDRLRASGLKAEATTRQSLLHAMAFDSAVLASGNGAVTLSPSMAASRSLLNDLFSQPFMQPLPAPAAAAAAPAAGTPISWDINTLQQAEALAESYLAFAPQADAALSRSIQQQVRSVAGAEAAAHIGALLNLAARPAGQLAGTGGLASARNLADERSRATLQEISGLAGALPLLVNLRNMLRQAGAVSAAAALDRRVSAQAVRLLRQLTSDLASAAPYQLVDPRLSFWNGSPPLAEPAFGADSPTDLASTLVPRRNFVATLAREYAAPLVSYLRDPGTFANGATAGLVAPWRSILDTLDRYDRSDPDNALTRLQQFITVGMDKINLSNCQELNAGYGAAGNYFAEQLQNIRRAILSRCGTLIHADTADLYASLSTIFNRQIAGRFPFAPTASPAAVGTGAVLGAADPRDVRSFFMKYGPALPSLRAQFQSSGNNGQASRAAEVFLTELRAVDAVFAPMLADPSGQTPLSYQVDITFFTNPGSARGQNQVIDAAVSTGSQRASSMNGTSRIVWTNGQPMRVDLRWAANAPMVPDAIPGHQWPYIAGRNAEFDFSGNWALLRLIRAQMPGSADFNALQDREPEVVEFDVPLKRNPNAAIGGNTAVDRARVYMRLALSGVVQSPGQPNKTVAVALPEFPSAAPLLGQTVSDAGGMSNHPPIPLIVPTAMKRSP